MEQLIRDFKAVVAAVERNRVRYVRGRLWDPESGIACATGIMVANLEHGRPLAPALDRLGLAALRFETGSPVANRLSELNQFEADDLLAAAYQVPRWQAQFVAAKEDSSPAAAIARINGPKDFVSGGRGEPLVDYVAYLGTRTPEDWDHIRDLAEPEYERARTLIQGENRAAAAVLNDNDEGLSDIVFAQYWTRAVVFRGLYDARRNGHGNKGSDEWDTAWLAWGTDMARRAAIEVLAAGRGLRLSEDQSSLRLLGWQLT